MSITDILMILLLPVGVIFLMGTIIVLKKRNDVIASYEVADVDQLSAKISMLLSMAFTSVAYGIFEGLCIARLLDSKVVLSTPTYAFIIISGLGTISVLAKLVITTRYISLIAKDRSEGNTFLARCVIFQAIAEVPGLIGLVYFFILCKLE